MQADRLSLYLELEDGQSADLETVSRGVLAFIEAVQEIARYIDPFSDVKIELIGTTEGSLSLDTKIKFRTASGTKEITLRALIIICMAWIGTQAVTYIAGKEIASAWEYVFGTDEVSVSDADKQDISERVIKGLAARVGERGMKQLYAELEKDPAVKGVGVSKKPGVRPADIVPRSQFSRRSGAQATETPAVKTRRRVETANVILVSPVLTPDRKRRWKFRIGRHEFGAPIKDEYFLDALYSGKHPIIMKGNIQMNVRLETQEKFENGAWVETDHIVWHVIGVPGQYQGPQQSLSFDQPPQTDNQNKKGK